MTVTSPSDGRTGTIDIQESGLQDATGWHTLSADEALEMLRTSASGLASPEAAQRLHRYGPNELHAVKRASAWHTFAAQFKNVLIMILLSATFVSGLLGHTVEAVVITVIVLFAVLLGFIQEYRAERAIEALRSMAAPVARVLRDALETVVPARELVPGDIVLLRAGNRIPADARLIQAVNLAIDEAPLTGESTAVEKTTARLEDGRLPLGDRRNMTYAGTLVAHGRRQADPIRLSVVRRPFANRWLNMAVAWEMLILVAIIYVPFFQRSFGTFSLTPSDWVLTAALAASIVPVIEVVKWMTRRGWLGEVV